MSRSRPKVQRTWPATVLNVAETANGSAGSYMSTVSSGVAPPVASMSSRVTACVTVVATCRASCGVLILKSIVRCLSLGTDVMETASQCLHDADSRKCSGPLSRVVHPESRVHPPEGLVEENDQSPDRMRRSG